MRKGFRCGAFERKWETRKNLHGRWTILKSIGRIPHAFVSHQSLSSGTHPFRRKHGQWGIYFELTRWRARTARL